jgi:hypothetical protein
VQSTTSVEIQRGLDKFGIDAGLTYLENEPVAHMRKTALYRERYLFVTGRRGAVGRRVVHRLAGRRRRDALPAQ